MTERLRIAVVALDFHRQGGSEGRTSQLVDALAAAGHEVHLVGARFRGEWDARTTLHPIHVVSHPHWLEVLQFSRRAAALVRSGRFDVVHNQIRPFVPGVVTVGGGCHRFYLEEVVPREGGRVRAFFKRMGPLHRVLLGMEREGFRADRCPFVICNSGLSRDGILKYYPFPSERIVVAYNGVDATRFSPARRAHHRDRRREALGIGPDDLLALFVGSGFHRKGLRHLMEAMIRVRAMGLQAHLCVVGGGATGPWRQHAAHLGLAECVSFAGHVSDPESFYAAADVFVLPTFFDPFANATLEAMASGLPVVTTRQNGAAEIMRNGVDGLVLERADDVAALGEGLARLNDPTLRAGMGERARETALKYPWEGPLEKTLAVYKAMVEGKAGVTG